MSMREFTDKWSRLLSFMTVDAGPVQVLNLPHSVRFSSVQADARRYRSIKEHDNDRFQSSSQPATAG